MANSLHRDSRVLQAGTSLQEAQAAAIFLHGRGASASDILGLAHEMSTTGFAFLAPEAANHTWYPNSFLAPLAQNEPWLSSALEKVGSVVALAREAGIPDSKIVLCGFSQGACLATEFVARNARRYGGLIAYTGGLIGPPEAQLEHAGSLDGTKVFFGSGDPDPHVPWSRVQKSAEVLEGMGASVISRRYPGLPHTVSQDEIAFGRQILAGVLI